LFSDSNRKISSTLVRDFINQYTLHRQGEWRCDEVIDRLESFGRGSTASAVDVETFATQLADCLPKYRKQNSGASKFAFFSQPFSKHHILDSIVIKALQGRRSGKTIPIGYAAFLKVVSEEYSLEAGDFDCAFENYLALQNIALTPAHSDFHRRYFFDKFLLAQGAFVQAEQERRRAGTSADSGPRRKRDRESAP
jgi:hypothetical protein